MKSFTMFKKSDTTSDVPTSTSLFSRIKATFSRVRVGRSAKVAADVGFVPETVSSVKALIPETPGPVPTASEKMEVVAQPLSNAAGHAHTSIATDLESRMLSPIPASSSWSAHPAAISEMEMVAIPSSCTALLAEEKISSSSSMSPSINGVCTFLNSLPTSCTALLGEAKVAPSSSVPADFATFVASLPSFWRALAAAQDATPSSSVPASASFLASVPSSWTTLLSEDEAAAISTSVPESTSKVTTTSISASFSWSGNGDATLVPSLSSADDMLVKFIKAMDDGGDGLSAWTRLESLIV